MNVTFDPWFLVWASISVVGVVEYVKGFFPSSWPSWVWRLVILPVSVVVAVAADGGVYQVATNALSLLAMTQIGYPMLVQLPGAAISAFRNKLE